MARPPESATVQPLAEKSAEIVGLVGTELFESNRDPARPFGEVHRSPLFAYAARHTPWLQDGRRGLWRFRLMAAGIAVIGLLFVAVLDLPGKQAAALIRSYPTYPVLDSLQVGALAILGVSIVLSALSDVVPALAAAGGWIRNATLWELLRVSPLAQREIVVGQVAALRLSGWRLMTVATVVRLVGLSVLIAAAAAEGLNRLVSVLYAPPESGTMVIILLLFTAMGIALTYVLTLEPGWRLSLHAALAVAFAVRFQTESLRLVANLLIIIMAWVLTPVFLALVTAAGFALIFFPATIPLTWFYG